MRTVLLILACCIGLTLQAQIKAIPFGSNSVIQYDLHRGVYDVVCGGRVVIKDAYAVIYRMY